MKEILDRSYWDNRYKNKQTGWDIGMVSRPLKEYIDQLQGRDMAILIPGCGNAYEAAYLLEKGFTNITLIDIVPDLVNSIKERLSAYPGHQLNVICGDFFSLNQKFDLVLEQTFFCALNPTLRKNYADKMFELLNPGGKLVGVLFNRSFEGGPPFGGNKKEYAGLFSERFHINVLNECYHSIDPRKGTELFINFSKV